MKYLLMLVLFSLQLTAFSQNLSVKPSGGLVKIQLDTIDYLIQKDTLNGVITVVFTPTTQVIKELESSLGTVSTQLADVQTQIDNLQREKKELQRRQREINKLLVDIQNPETPKPEKIEKPEAPKKSKSKTSSKKKRQ